MGNLVNLHNAKRGESKFRIRGEALELLTRVLEESGQFAELPPLETLPYPVYTQGALQTLAGGGLCLEKDFPKACPVHFALVILGNLYHQSVKIALSQRKDASPEELAELELAPMSVAARGLQEFTINNMMMKFFTPETYNGERFILIFNPLTEKVELWAGLQLHIEQPTENTTESPSESPGAAPVEEKSS